MKRIGPKMVDVVIFVVLHPGISKYKVAKYVGPHGSVPYGYRTVNRAIKAGLIADYAKPGEVSRLYAISHTVNAIDLDR